MHHIQFFEELTGTSPVGQETASYTVLTGNNAATVATNLASSINSTMSNIGVSDSASGSVISITAPSDRAATFSCDAPGNDETIALSGSTPIADLHKQLYYFYDCAGNRTGVEGDSSGSFPGGLSTDATKYSYNNLNQLTASAAG
ncbi:MAG: hypothetical protein K2X81_20655, partial [Candidatus Obscuribacterales bacterium]|nr:hypothetical protein [Candidatus Obscuribacterales bacterium]